MFETKKKQFRDHVINKFADLVITDASDHSSFRAIIELKLHGREHVGGQVFAEMLGLKCRHPQRPLYVGVLTDLFSPVCYWRPPQHRPLVVLTSTTAPQRKQVRQHAHIQRPLWMAAFQAKQIGKDLPTCSLLYCRWLQHFSLSTSTTSTDSNHSAAGATDVTDATDATATAVAIVTETVPVTATGTSTATGTPTATGMATATAAACMSVDQLPRSTVAVASRSSYDAHSS